MAFERHKTVGCFFTGLVDVTQALPIRALDNRIGNKGAVTVLIKAVISAIDLLCAYIHT